MPNVQFRFDFAPRPMMRLQEIQAIMKENRFMGRTPPSRNLLIQLCEDGTFEAIKTRVGWLVFEDSFEGWLESMQLRKAA